MVSYLKTIKLPCFKCFKWINFAKAFEIKQTGKILCKKCEKEH